MLLLTDDQTLDDMAAMPKTAKLMGRLGTRFSRAISQYPLCCPARATLLTGQESHNHGVMGNDPPWGGFTFFDDEETIPVWLQRRGYRTGIVGKYLQHYEEQPTYVPPGWNEWYVPTTGTYHFYNRLVNENGTLRWHWNEYQTTYLADQVSQMVRNRGQDGSPFFIWANFLAPHFGGPVEPGDPRHLDPSSRVDTPAVETKYRGHFAGLRNPRDASFNEPDNGDKARFMQRQQALPPEDLDTALQQRRESLLSVDDAVVRIIRSLRATDQLRRTLVVFTSDNGFSAGQHRWFHKVLGYEEDIRVPLYVAGPGFAPGAVRDRLVTLTDVAATFVEASGSDPTLAQDGTPLQRHADDPSYGSDRAVLLEAGGWPFPKLDRLYRGVRTSDDLVYLRWYDGHEEIYDLSRDPLQLDGTVDSQERDRLPELRDLVIRLKECTGRTCAAGR